MSKGSVYIDGDLSKKFYEFEPGETVKLALLCSIDSLGKGNVTMSILDCELDNIPKSMDDALRRAMNEEDNSKDSDMMVRARIEPYPG